MKYEVKLDTGSYRDAIEAKNIELTIRDSGFPVEVNTKYTLSLSDAASLMRQLADELGKYREAVHSRYTEDINKSVNELEEMLK